MKRVPLSLRRTREADLRAALEGRVGTGDPQDRIEAIAIAESNEWPSWARRELQRAGVVHKLIRKAFEYDAQLPYPCGRKSTSR